VGGKGKGVCGGVWVFNPAELLEAGQMERERGGRPVLLIMEAFPDMPGGIRAKKKCERKKAVSKIFQESKWGGGGYPGEEKRVPSRHGACKGDETSTLGPVLGAGQKLPVFVEKK